MKAGKIFGKIAGIGAVGGAIAGIAYCGKKNAEKETMLKERYKVYYELTNQWLRNKNEGKKIDGYFKENHIASIAVYGMGTLGELFCEEIKDSGVKVSYFIDKNADMLNYGMDGIPAVSLDGIAEQEAVDAIVVTPVFDFDEIQEELEAVTDIELLSLEDVIYSI